MNWRGAYALLYRETWRFLRVIVQTLVAPMVSALLFLVVFGYLLEGRVTMYPDVPYTVFLVPGLMMMSIIQNATANASSSIMQSKLMGNLVFVLMAPLSSIELFIGFVGAAVIRGVLVALCVYVVAVFFTDVSVQHYGILCLMTLLSSMLLGATGLVAGMWADKIEELALFQNFFILPLSFLSGVFYSINTLPEFWQNVSHVNPFFYMIDGFRYAFLGQSDVSIGQSVAVVALCTFIVATLSIVLLKRGYKIRS